MFLSPCGNEILHANRNGYNLFFFKLGALDKKFIIQKRDWIQKTFVSEPREILNNEIETKVCYALPVDNG